MIETLQEEVKTSESRIRMLEAESLEMENKNRIQGEQLVSASE